MKSSELAQQVDTLFEKYTRPGSPGCALAVMKDGAMIYKQSYGLANLEHNIPITATTRFNIGSESKQFTTFAILLLEDEGKLSLDDEIKRYFPESPDFGHPITIRHLLHHTSGLRCSFPALLVLSGCREGDITTTADVLHLFHYQRDLNFAPGEEYSYSNLGYVLLAQIVKQVSGKPFAAFCKEHIFVPLEMSDTLVHDNYDEIICHSAQSYFTDNGKSTIMPLMDSIIGPTNVYSTIEDIARWDENFYTGTVGGNELITRMHEQGMLNNGKQITYACGLNIVQHKGLKLIDHGGLHGGYCTSLLRFPDQHFSVAVMFNTFIWDTRQQALRVADTYLADAYQPSEKTAIAASIAPALKLSQEKLKAVAGKYFHTGRAALREITFEEGELHAFGMTLIPSGEHEFALSDSPEVSIRFMPARGGSPDRIQIISPVSSFVYDRVNSTESTADDLEAYTGRYFSPELHALWTIYLKDGKLFVRRQKYMDSSLTPLFVDAFLDHWSEILGWPGYDFTVLFNRDEHNTIKSLSVTDVDARMRHLKFFRQ